MAADGRLTSRRKPTVTFVRVEEAAGDWRPKDSSGKPTLAGLGVDPATLDWQRSGTDEGSFEIAFVAGVGAGWSGEAGRSGESDQGGEVRQGGEAGQSGKADWVLLRIAGDPDGRVLVYDRTEWLCFIDGAGQGEFDWPAELMVLMDDIDATAAGGQRRVRRSFRSSSSGLSG